MTKQEHEMMMLMFARMHEAIGILTEVLKSRDILTQDDLKAFSHATHADDRNILRYAAQAQSDYRKFAAASWVKLPDV